MKPPKECLRPDKILYPTFQEAMASLKAMAPFRRKGCHPYPCRPCGGYHIGRNRRRTRDGRLKKGRRPRPSDDTAVDGMPRRTTRSSGLRPG